ncbi:MAG: hypothetical protein ACREDR_07400 [Blastocatellia bacterium]
MIDRVLTVVELSKTEPPALGSEWYALGWIIITNADLTSDLVILDHDSFNEVPRWFASILNAPALKMMAGSSIAGESGGQIRIPDLPSASALYESLRQSIDEMIADFFAADDTISYRIELQLRECRSTDGTLSHHDLRLQSMCWHSSQTNLRPSYVC